MILKKERVWTRVETGNQLTATGWTGNQYFAVGVSISSISRMIASEFVSSVISFIQAKLAILKWTSGATNYN